jgi:hypothetical protein
MTIDLKHDELQTLQGALQKRIQGLMYNKEKCRDKPNYDEEKYNDKIQYAINLYNKISFKVMEDVVVSHLQMGEEDEKRED